MPLGHFGGYDRELGREPRNDGRERPVSERYYFGCNKASLVVLLVKRRARQVFHGQTLRPSL